MSLLAQGLKNSEIAGSLAISESTVKTYLPQLYEKLGVKDRFELALYGLKHFGPKSSAAPSAPAQRSAATDQAGPEEKIAKGLTVPLLPTLQ